MAKFIRERLRYQGLYELAHGYVKMGVRLPDLVLDEKFTTIRMAEFEMVLCGDFFACSFEFCKKVKGGKVWLMMLEPHPEAFYFERYRKFGLIEFDCNETLDEVVDIIDEYPVEGIADTIITIAEQFVVFSEDEDWCIWGDRNPETVIIGFANTEKYQAFKGVIPTDESYLLMTPAEAFESFMAYPVSRIFSNEQKVRFMENYIRGGGDSA